MFSKLAIAQTDTASTNLYDLSLQELMNITVVSASKSNQSQSDAPNIISAYNSEYLLKYSFTNLNELLYTMPGFSPSQDYERKTLGFRGMFEGWNNNHQLMLVDGVPFNDNSYGTAYTWEISPLFFSKSVEIIRGPGGALYGTNAMNGVISLNSFNNSDIEGNGVIRITGGTNKTSMFDVLTGVENDNCGMVLAFSQFSTAGNEYETYDGSGRTDEDGKLLKFKTNDNRSNSYIFTKVYGKGKYEGLSLQFHNQDWNYGTGHGWLFNAPDQPENMNEFRRIIVLKYAPIREDKVFSYELTSRYQNHGFNWNMRFYPDGAFGGYYPYGVSEYLKTNTEDVFIRAQGKLSKNNHQLLFGAEGTKFIYNGDEIHYANIDMNTWSDPDSVTRFYQLNPWFEYIKDKPVNNMAGFIQYISPKFFEKLQITASGRFDNLAFKYDDLVSTNDKSKSFSMLTPRIALVYNATKKITLKGIYSKAFRTPSPTELFGVNTYTLASNLQELKPEIVTNIDIAVDWKINEKINFKTNVFKLDFENQIAYSVANANLSTNIYTLNTAGIELELQYAFNHFSGFANYTFCKRLSEEISDTTIKVSNNKITWAPSSTANVGIVYNHKKFYTLIVAHYQGKALRRTSDIYDGMENYRDKNGVKAWLSGDLKFAYHISPKIETSILIKNISNGENYLIKNFAYPFDYKMDDRQILIELIFKI
ncbi:MAG TPA: TonB-dependent receptor [Bacteroidales bacterium]|nr:TonB-dependent receptor [Bacteroidales bacterium]